MPANTGAPIAVARQVRAARSWPARLHTLLGLALGVFALYHGVQNYPAVERQEAWVDRAIAGSLGFGFGMLVLAALGVHAVLGLASWQRQRRALAKAGAERDWGLDFQLLTGGLLLAFIVFHVLQLWPSGAGPHASVREPYARLWQQLGHPPWLALYVAGITAVAFHAGHGLSRLLARAGLALPQTAARVLGGVLGLLLLLIFLQIVTRFALGEALIPAFT